LNVWKRGPVHTDIDHITRRQILALKEFKKQLEAVFLYLYTIKFLNINLTRPENKLSFVF
jgi:hypothetical protein